MSKMPTGGANMTFSLEVRIKSCCLNIAIKRLRKIPGVESISYDAEQELLIVFGDVNSNLLIEQFADWGLKADLVPSRHDLGSHGPASDQQPDKQKIDHDHDDFPNNNKDNKAEIKGNPNLVWITNPRPKKNGILGFIRKVSEFTKIVKPKKPKVEVKAWQFPNIPEQKQPEQAKAPPPHPVFPQMPLAYGPPRGYPFGQTMMPSQVPHHRSYGGHSIFAQPLLPRPPMWGPQMQMRPPGAMQSSHRRSSGRMFNDNPMIHYTNYEDNYYH